jgi:hypothetical protein
MKNRFSSPLIALALMLLGAGNALAVAPTAFDVSGGGVYCARGSGVNIFLSGSEIGVNYQLYNDEWTSGSPLAGTGSALTFNNAIFPGAYTVIATRAGSGETTSMNGSATVDTKPASYGGMATTAGGTVCSGSSTLITLSGKTGSIVRWELSTDGSTWTTNISTANPLNTGNLTATTYFRAVVQSGVCSPATYAGYGCRGR